MPPVVAAVRVTFVRSRLLRERTTANIACVEIASGLPDPGQVSLANIRLVISARKQIISTMRLVGATPGFIRTPLILEGTLQGAARLLPGADPPDFDLLAYQLPFVLGILVGWDVVVRGSADRGRLGAGRLAAVGAAAAMLCVARRVVAEDTFAAQLLVGRPSFGPIRAVNFALLAVLALNARVRLARWVRREPLAMLGRQSLYVFSAHAVLVLWLRPWRADLGRVGASVELAATAAFLAAMVGVAWWRERPRGA